MKVEATVINVKGFTEMTFPVEYSTPVETEYIEHIATYGRDYGDVGYQTQYDELLVSFVLDNKEQRVQFKNVYFDRAINLGDKIMLKRKKVNGKLEFVLDQ